MVASLRECIASDTELVNLVSEAEALAQSLRTQRPLEFTNFTDHAIAHSENGEERLDRLIYRSPDRQNAVRPSPEEAAFLLAANQLRDIGLTYPLFPNEHQRNDVDCDTIRAEHTARSSSYIQNYWHMYCSWSNSQRNYLSQLCANAHPLHSLDDVPHELSAGPQRPHVRLRQLATLLRVADDSVSPLFDATGQPLSSEVVVAYHTVNEQLIRYLSQNPDKLRSLDSRVFEELVAELFARQGFQTTLTPRTRDGGKDVYALKHDQFGKSLYVIECKRYATDNKVGVDTVRSLYGVVTAENATKGIIATTSSFTKPAIDFAFPLEYKLSLRDFDALTEWLSEFTTKDA